MINPNLSIDDYHKHEAIGSTGIINFLECPRLFVNPRPRNEAMRFGNIAHVAMLEQEKFGSMFLIAPEGVEDKRAKEWKHFVNLAAEQKKEPLLYKEFLEVEAMCKELKNNRLATALLTGGKAEVSFFAKCPESELEIKARPDYISVLAGYGALIVDYKTTAISLGTSKQGRHAFGLNRHLQAAHHKRVVELATGKKISGVVYVVQSVVYPYLVRVFRMPMDLIDKATGQTIEILRAIAECKKNNYFPGYPEEIEDYIEPAWLDFELN